MRWRSKVKIACVATEGYDGALCRGLNHGWAFPGPSRPPAFDWTRLIGHADNVILFQLSRVSSTDGKVD
jgi:hypothetical protein